MERAYNISQLMGLRKYAREFSSLGDDYIFTRVTGDSMRVAQTTGPYRVEVMTWALCLSGEMEIDVNLNHYHLTANSLLLLGPDNIISLSSDYVASFDGYMLIVAQQFMKEAHIDLAVLNTLPIRSPAFRQPIMQLSNDECALLRRYFDLVHLNTEGNTTDLYVRSISRCLMASMCYQVIQFATRRYSEQADDEMQQPTTRRSSYVRDFMQLVYKHHRRERSLAFYASRLFISPKYLSLVIKESTGRTAIEWIDDHVLLEAKNLLRFTDMSIQQISYELNFQNQGAFGKYFKHLTGMSPRAYRKV